MALGTNQFAGQMKAALDSKVVDVNKRCAARTVPVLPAACLLHACCLACLPGLPACLPACLPGLPAACCLACLLPACCLPAAYLLPFGLVRGSPCIYLSSCLSCAVPPAMNSARVGAERPIAALWLRC